MTREKLTVVPWFVAYDKHDMTFCPFCNLCGWRGESTSDNEVAARELENHLTSDTHRGLD